MRHEKKIEITTTWECVNMQEVEHKEPDTTTTINHKQALDEKAKKHIIKCFEDDTACEGKHRFKSVQLDKYIYYGGFEINFK